MEAVAKRLLVVFKRNLVYLKTKLDYTQLQAYIHQYDILQGEVQNAIKALPTEGQQIEYLLSDALPRRPPKDVVLFAKALIESGQNHHLKEIRVSAQDMDFISGFNEDQTSHDVPVKTDQERSGEDKPLWDPSHPDGEAYIEGSELGNKLNKVVPKLQRIVHMADLWAHLQSHGVMGAADVDRCKLENRAEADQVKAITDFLMKDVVWRVHAFFRSLAQTNQAGVINVVLGPNGKEPYIQNLNE